MRTARSDPRWAIEVLKRSAAAGLGAPRALVHRVDRAALRFRSHPRFWEPAAPIEDPNTLFSRREIRRLRGHVQRIAHRDAYLRGRLAERRIGGVRDWEYGTLLGALQRHPERSSWQVLDVGSGNSTFPLYLLETSQAGRVTTLDLPGAYEAQTAVTRERERAAGIERVEGSMLDLPFPDGSFDLVMCISAIEHLDGLPSAHRRGPQANPQLPYDRYVADTRTALEQIMRTVRPGGLLYVTTDAYLADRQRTDTWNPPAERIWSAYRFEEVEGLFLETVRSGGFALVGRPDYRRELLEQSIDRSTYRGRWFTTFAVLARRNAG